MIRFADTERLAELIVGARFRILPFYHNMTSAVAHLRLFHAGVESSALVAMPALGVR